MNLAIIGRKWQRRLGLHEWLITWEAVDRPRINDDNDLADVTYEEGSLEATVRVATRDSDIEALVIHELLHILVSGLTCAVEAAAQSLGAEGRTAYLYFVRQENEKLVRRLERYIGEALK